MRTSLKKRNKILKFFLTIMLLGVIAGIILYFNLSANLKTNIMELFTKSATNIKLNNIFFHLFIILIFAITTLTIILEPFNIFYLFYESVCLGFVLASFGHINGFKGIIYAVIYFLLNKAFYLLILLYLNINAIIIIKKIINSFVKKDNISIRDFYLNYFLKIIICIVALFLFDIIIYFFGNKILSMFQFLL